MSEPPPTPPHLPRVFAILLWTAFAWTLANSLYVYGVLQGRQMFRLESAVFLLVLLLALVVLSRRSDSTPGVELAGRDRTVVLTAAIALWLVAYLPLLHYPFLSDDYVFLGLYRSARDITAARQFFRPLFAAVFVALHRIGHGSPVPFHVLSFALHMAGAALVYSLVARLIDRTAATIGFVLFLLNPLQTEAVLWVSGLQDVLWTVFLLAAIRCYVGERTLSAGRLAATVLLAIAALLSKETAVCFVAVLIAADLAYFRMDRGALRNRAYLAFGAVLVAYLFARGRFIELESGFLVAPSRYFVKQFVSIPYRFFAQPWNESAVHVPLPIACLISVVVISGLFASVVWRGASRRLLAGPILILLATLPVYSYFYVAPNLASTRYIYFAAAGWSLLVADCTSRIVRSRIWVLASVLTLAALSFAGLELNSRPWRLAADLVATLEASLGHGGDLRQTVADWEAGHGVTVTFDRGVPHDVHGVGIFINGYPQFVELAHR